MMTSTIDLMGTVVDVQEFLKRTDLMPEQRLYAEGIKDFCLWRLGHCADERLRGILPWAT